MRRLTLPPVVPARSHMLPWKTDVLPPRNDARYAAKAGRATEGLAYAASEAPVVAPLSRPLVDVMADALGISKGKTRKAIQAGKVWVRCADGGDRQVFDPDYKLVAGETARLDS